MPVRLAPGDVLVFDARLCHTPAGRSASAPDIAFALHMYAGHGVDVKHLNSTLPCAAEIQ
jgi:ectoine hydroxylase-related dioxygenase (phytanoyl-CoA dioxygenase family)